MREKRVGKKRETERIIEWEKEGERWRERKRWKFARGRELEEVERDVKSCGRERERETES